MEAAGRAGGEVRPAPEEELVAGLKMDDPGSKGAS
jgi:hypothetical protein